VVGDTGLVVEPGDVGELRSALARLIRDPALAAELGERASRRVAELFGWAAIASRHEVAYEAVLRRAPSSEAGKLEQGWRSEGSGLPAQSAAREDDGAMPEHQALR
jgi:hypothetical protein